jgi:hypothetical protein
LKQSIKALSLELLNGQDASEFEVDELSSESSCDEAQAQKQPAKKQKIVEKMNWSNKALSCWLLRQDLAAVTTMRVSIVTFGITEGQAELDSHADTMVLSDNTALIIHDCSRPVCVHGYDESVAQCKHCKTVTGVLAYDHPSNLLPDLSSISSDSRLESLTTKSHANAQQWSC